MLKTIPVFLLLFISNPSFSQELFQFPQDANGPVLGSEKFEMIKEYYKYHNGDNDTQKLDPTHPYFTKGPGEQQVGDDGEVEAEIFSIVNPSDPNNIIVGAMNLKAADQIEPLQFPIFVTYDFGETWQRSTFSGVDENDQIIGGGDPMFAFDENGRLYYTWITINVNVSEGSGLWTLNIAYSDDGGMTWNENLAPLSSNSFTSLADLSRLADKQWMVSDLNPSSPFYGNVYLVFVEIVLEQPETQYFITTIRKVRGEMNFQRRKTILSDPNALFSQYSSIDVANDGKVYITWMSNLDNSSPDNQEIYFTSSTDGGLTYSSPRKITNVAFPDLGTLGQNIVGVSGNRLYPCPHIAVDKSGTSSDGTLYMAFTGRGIDRQTTTGFDIYLTRSVDGGLTWTDPRPVHNTSDPNANQFYSTISVNDEGVVALGWYDTRGDVNRTQTNYYIGYSFDGGENFEEMQVSSSASNFGIIDVKNNGLGIGEYNELLVVDDYIIPFWADGRTNDGDIAVYTNFVNIGTSSIEEKSGPINKLLRIDGPLLNPTSDVVAFELSSPSSAEVEFCIYDVTGRLISSVFKSISGEGNRVEQSVEQLESGIYMASFSSAEGVWTRQFVKE